MVWRARAKRRRCDVCMGSGWERARSATCGGSFAVLGKLAHWAPGTARWVRSNAGGNRLTSAWCSRLICFARCLRFMLRIRRQREGFLGRAEWRIVTTPTHERAAAWTGDHAGRRTGLRFLYHRSAWRAAKASARDGGSRPETLAATVARPERP